MENDVKDRLGSSTHYEVASATLKETSDTDDFSWTIKLD
jgi:hypothetical protein